MLQDRQDQERMERERDVSGQLPPGFRVNSTPVAATAAANVNTGAVDIGATAAAVVAPAVGEWYETWTAFPIEVVPFIQTRQGHKKIDLVQKEQRETVLMDSGLLLRTWINSAITTSIIMNAIASYRLMTCVYSSRVVIAARITTQTNPTSGT